jgi:hypothetical protein
MGIVTRSCRSSVGVETNNCRVAVQTRQENRRLKPECLVVGGEQSILLCHGNDAGICPLRQESEGRAVQVESVVHCSIHKSRTSTTWALELKMDVFDLILAIQHYIVINISCSELECVARAGSKGRHAGCELCVCSLDQPGLDQDLVSERRIHDSGSRSGSDAQKLNGEVVGCSHLKEQL